MVKQCILTTVMYIWRHDICHVTASRWCHICQNVSPILSIRYNEAIFAVGIIKKVTGEKRQGGWYPPPPPGRPRVNACWIISGLQSSSTASITESNVEPSMQSVSCRVESFAVLTRMRNLPSCRMRCFMSFDLYFPSFRNRLIPNFMISGSDLTTAVTLSLLMRARTDCLNSGSNKW